MSTEPRPLTPRERIYAKALMAILDALCESENGRDFLSRIVADDELDPESGYICEWCGHWHKGKECHVTTDNHIICNMCRAAEQNYGAFPKEGENESTAKE
jgi:hypothetical protein